MKLDNLRKKKRIFNQLLKKAEEREKRGFFEGAALAYIEAANVFPQNIYPEKTAGCFYNAGRQYWHAKKKHASGKLLVTRLND